MDRKSVQFVGALRLLILERGGTITIREATGDEHCAYGIPSTACSVSSGYGLLALVARMNRRSTSELHIFRLEADGEIGEEIGKTTVDGSYQSIQWSPDAQFLVLVGREGCAVFRCQPLTLICFDEGSRCCFVGGLFAELENRSQNLSFWRLENNSKVGEVSLYRRSLSLLDVCGVLNTVFSLYSDYSLTVAHVDKTGTAEKLQKIEGLFPSNEENRKVEELSPKLLIFCRGNVLIVALKNSPFVQVFHENPESVSHVGTCLLPHDATLMDVDFSGDELSTAAVERLSTRKIELCQIVVGPPKFVKSSLGRNRFVPPETPSAEQRSSATDTHHLIPERAEQDLGEKCTTSVDQPHIMQDSTKIVTALAGIAAVAILLRIFYFRTS